MSSAPSRLERSVRWVRGEIPFCLVLVVLIAAFGYLVVDSGRWGRTSGGVAVALLLAALLRAVVPKAHAGLLAVRHRAVDVAVYLLLGVVILVVDVRLHD